uniref:Phosphoglycolate phosphatase, HAD superfamily n=1 Tax=Candidatus Kentrum sp. LPFa TaxID=2126335 RepID=A0A450W3V0_9GAMM|nr:MAG: Phosphoglycolate phosphatase, HAD superfamily [Candidatus Kentron sp. LPFa]
MTLLALDFDGVLCDSAWETGISAWKAGVALRGENSSLPPEGLLVAFRQMRPVVEAGHEAVLVMKLLQEGLSPAELLARFPEHGARLMVEMGWDHETLKKAFGAVRDHWIETDADGWSALSPLYPGIDGFLQDPAPGVEIYIITTKQERFVRRLLDYNGIDFPSERIFGLDRGVSKERVLLELSGRYPGRRLCFVEDRLATLVRVMERSDLAMVPLYLADWGYNTASDRESARGLQIPVLDLYGFIALTFLENDR